MAAIGARKLIIDIDGTEYQAEVTSADISGAEADSDTVTYAEANSGGGRDYALNITLLQDAATGTLWSEIFDNAGADAAVTLIFYGNETASTEQPHFTTTATISEPDGVLLGGAASTSVTARQTITVAWSCTRPVKVTA